MLERRDRTRHERLPSASLARRMVNGCAMLSVSAASLLQMVAGLVWLQGWYPFFDTLILPVVAAATKGILAEGAKIKSIKAAFEQVRRTEKRRARGL